MSVTSWFNIGKDHGESLLSGGEEGQGEISVALHDTAFNPSTPLHHAASLLGYLREKARLADVDIINATTDNESAELTEEFTNECMSFTVLLETDGHNLKFLRTVLSCLLCSSLAIWVACSRVP